MNGDVNSPTHNSFGLVGGLNVVDTDSAGAPTTLAGNATVGPGGFNVVPEPSAALVFSIGLLVMRLGTRRRSS